MEIQSPPFIFFQNNSRLFEQINKSRIIENLKKKKQTNTGILGKWKF
jgi:hypothetical protein